jgi:hypothetical protein
MLNYEAIVRTMKSRYQLRVRRWRRQMSGCSWRVHYHSGRCVNWIESPYPKTPISLAIFLHEVGHHALGFRHYRVHSEEEYRVWLWALKEMRKLGIEPDERVRRRFERSMQYAVRKDVRRDAHARLPEALKRFLV